MEVMLEPRVWLSSIGTRPRTYPGARPQPRVGVMAIGLAAESAAVVAGGPLISSAMRPLKRKQVSYRFRSAPSSGRAGFVIIHNAERTSGRRESPGARGNNSPP